MREARLARDLGYDLALLSFAGRREASEDALLDHARAVGEVLPVFGFYLQEAVGGRRLSLGFWRRFCALECVAAVKVAPFDRYRTLDVVRAVVDVGREGEVALYTGNDDQIALDLVTPFRLERAGTPVTVRFVGGLLGHWAVWTRGACAMLAEARALSVDDARALPRSWLERAVAITDANAAFFDAAHGFRGCIAGLHEVLRRQGLLEGIWCLDPAEGLSPGQADEIERVRRAYPELADDEFVARHRDAWLT